jgi:transposase
LSFVLTLENPQRFEESRQVGAYLGLVPGKDHSGERDPQERISRGCYELAQEWLANAENGRSTVNRTNRRIRILMRFFSQVHNTL